MPKQDPASTATKVEELIAEKDDVLHPCDTVQTAGDKMRALDTDVLPVSEGRHLVGVMDEKNPDRRAASHGHDPNTTTIAESMNRHVVYCFEDDDCAEALRKMEGCELQHLPVVDRELRIVGLVSRGDLLARVPEKAVSKEAR